MSSNSTLERERQESCFDCEAHSRCCFRELPGEALKRFRSHLMIRRYSRGVTVFWEGDKATGLFVIRSGWLRLSHVTSEGKAVNLGFVGPGGILGLNEVMSDCCFATNAEVLDECELEFIQKRQFLPLLESNPKLAVVLLSVVSREAQKSTAEICAVVGRKPLEERLLSKLQELAAACGRPTAHGIRIKLPFTVQELADSIGCSRQWATRLLKTLQQQDRILRQGSWITLKTGQAGH